MGTLLRASSLAVGLVVLAAPAAAGQTSTMRVVISKGPHAGTYDLKNGQCDALDGQVISMFTPKLSGLSEGPRGLESMEVYTEPAKAGPDGFSVRVDFRTPSGQRVAYQIYAIPPALQASARTKPQLGRGTVTIRRDAAGTTAGFRGETADGVPMEGTVTCVKPG